jgi:plastocyanin
MRRRAYLASAGAALAGLSGCLGTLGTAGATCGEGCNIGMSTNAFDPETHETTVGTTVVWRNTSSRAHTVTAYDDSIPDEADFFASGGFESTDAAREGWNERLAGGIDPGGTFEYTPEVPGNYAYFCIPHVGKGMVGALEVTE